MDAATDRERAKLIADKYIPNLKNDPALTLALDPMPLEKYLIYLIGHTSDLIAKLAGKDQDAMCGHLAHVLNLLSKHRDLSLEADALHAKIDEYVYG